MAAPAAASYVDDDESDDESDDDLDFKYKGEPLTGSPSQRDAAREAVHSALTHCMLNLAFDDRARRQHAGVVIWTVLYAIAAPGSGFEEMTEELLAHPTVCRMCDDAHEGIFPTSELPDDLWALVTRHAGVAASRLREVLRSRLEFVDSVAALAREEPQPCAGRVVVVMYKGRQYTAAFAACKLLLTLVEAALVCPPPAHAQDWRTVRQGEGCEEAYLMACAVLMRDQEHLAESVSEHVFYVVKGLRDQAMRRSVREHLKLLSWEEQTIAKVRELVENYKASAYASRHIEESDDEEEMVDKVAKQMLRLFQPQLAMLAAAPPTNAAAAHNAPPRAAHNARNRRNQKRNDGARA